MKRGILLIITVFWATLSALAQGKLVTGTVTAEEGGDPIPGVNVLLKGSSTGTVTDIDGKFSINVDGPKSVLTFSFIGLAEEEVIVGSQSVINMTMTADIKQLTEVVVTALGIEREEKSLGYAIQQVDGSALTQTQESNIVSSMAGKIAGVQITSSGNMGGSSRILIRGANSVTGNNQPLFVVDGVPIDNSNYRDTNQASGGGGYDYGNAASDINPDDIESMSVLKGASAAALYGSRASNGVILITTKKGQKSQRIGLSVNSGVTFANPLVLPNYQNEYGGGAGGFGMNEEGQLVPGYAVDESWGPKMQGQLVRHWDSYDEWDTENYGKVRPWTSNPNNVRDFLRTGVTFNNNISLSGGTDKSTMRLSYTNVDTEGMLPNSSLKKNTLSFAGSYDFTKKFTAGFNATYVDQAAVGRTGTGYDGRNPFQQFNQWGQRQLDMDRLANYKNPDGSQRTWNRRSADDGRPKYADNPYWTRHENYNTDVRRRIFGNANATYKFTDYLSVTGRAMLDQYTDRRDERIAVGSVELSEYKHQTYQVQETNFDLIATFNKRYGEFSVNANAGGNRMEKSMFWNYGKTEGGLSVPNLYTLENSVSRPTIRDQRETKMINSVFASGSVGYKDMIYVDATIRNDWSSTLPAGNNSYLYPSISSSFVFSELPLLSDSEVLSFGKLRAGWAQVGSDTDPYKLMDTYAANPNYGSDPAFTIPDIKNNRDLKPEFQTSYEIGMDLRFLKDRVGLDFTYYHISQTDQIIPVAVSGASGYTQMYINAGKMENKGVEIMLHGTPIQTNDFSWDVTVNYARNRNKLVELVDGLDNIRLGSIFGGSVNARVGQPYGSIEGRAFERDASGALVVDNNGYYMSTSSDEVLGTTMADWTGGLSNTFRYKGFTLSALVDGSFGGSLFSISNYFGKYSGMMEETAANGIRENGMVFGGAMATFDANGDVIRDEKGNIVTSGENNQLVSAEGGFASLYGIHESATYDASFIKLREVSLGYTLPNSMMGKLPFRDVTFSVNGRNLALLYSNVPHIDPEAAAVNAGNVQGLEGAQVPSARTWGFNLKFKL
ncbi:SusC/RagA family TonB-linked outer membrane protein [Persicobacter diffluens]|uniref:SusC/RagA family TonB-linked outer membrane protein n=1 Tax=Persicobacter diffluens TaxID=981 RepID=A0AAN5ALP9_9BACT|nr:SusC/RagA family TonB-linked outer membrane protein [Persicobacter diffluens]